MLEDSLIGITNLLPPQFRLRMQHGPHKFKTTVRHNDCALEPYGRQTESGLSISISSTKSVYHQRQAFQIYPSHVLAFILADLLPVSQELHTKTGKSDYVTLLITTNDAQ